MEKDYRMMINHRTNFSEKKMTGKSGSFMQHHKKSARRKVTYGDQILFSDINKSIRFGIRLGDRTIMQTNGKGTIIVHTKTGKTKKKN
ncbi:hypothetical protein HN51_045219 [Arachis hypogaea]